MPDCWLEVSIRKVLPADHLDTGFSWFPSVYKRMLRWFPSFQVSTTWFIKQSLLIFIRVIYKIESRSRWPRGLRYGCAAARMLGLRVRIPPLHKCLSLVSVVFCHVEVFVTSRSPFRRSPTDCELETTVTRRPKPTTAVEPRKYTIIY